MKLRIYLVDFLGSRYLRHGVAAALAVGAGVILWSMVPHTVKTTPFAADAVTPPSRVNLGLSAEKIATAHLFGQSTTVSASAGPAVTAASVTVQGLFYSEDKSMAWAILEVDGKSGIFKTGDTLPDGERLADVGLNAIQIANGSALRVVEMAQSFGPASGIQLQGAANLYAQRDSFPGEPPSPAAPVVHRLRTVSLPQTDDPISQLQSLRQQLITH